MLQLQKVQHIAIICSNYELSKSFYTTILGFEILDEEYRAERNSYKLELALNGNYIIELFSFPNPPERLSFPEATGLRHIAFEVENLDESIHFLNKNNIYCEPIRINTTNSKRFTFFNDPDKLPIELCEK